MDSSDNLAGTAGPRRRPSPFDPRLRFDQYLLVWNTFAAHELRRFEVVRPIHGETILRRLLAQADDDMWDRLFDFYCRATYLHGVPLLQEHYEDIEQWLPRQLHGRFARAQLLKRKPMEFTGRFMEQAPEEPEDESPSDADAYIDLVLVNTEDRPVPRKLYKVEFSDGQVVQGHVDSNGHAHHDAVASGQCTITLPELDESMLASE